MESIRLKSKITTHYDFCPSRRTIKGRKRRSVQTFKCDFKQILSQFLVTYYISFWSIDLWWWYVLCWRHAVCPSKHIMSENYFWRSVLAFFLLCFHEKMVFCYQNCSDLLWEKIVLVISKGFQTVIDQNYFW